MGWVRRVLRGLEPAGLAGQRQGDEVRVGQPEREALGGAADDVEQELRLTAPELVPEFDEWLGVSDAAGSSENTGSI